jgi:hypothetical protein
LIIEDSATIAACIASVYCRCRPLFLIPTGYFMAFGCFDNKKDRKNGVVSGKYTNFVG